MSKGRGLASAAVRWAAAVGMTVALCATTATGAADERPTIDVSTPAARAASVKALQARHDVAMRSARAAAIARGERLAWSNEAGGGSRLARVEGGKPIYVGTLTNLRYGVAVGVNTVRDFSPFLTGPSARIGIWDGGAVRISHQEYGGRVVVKDGSDPLKTPDNFHPTAVCGVMASSGAFTLNSKGMATAMLVDSYDLENDIIEMTAAAASMSPHAGKLPLSNHSYANDAGWEIAGPKGNVPHWFGTIVDPMAIPNESEEFGRYNEYAADVDALVHTAPFFLPVRAISNDRDDGTPTSGTLFWYWDGADWASANYNGVAPKSDFFSGGYDTIRADSTGKNILSVGAVNIGESGGTRNLALATMTSFSGWGPTDDGRLKPDLVAPGVSLYSTSGTADINYSSGGAGTSFASPAVCGGAALVHQHYTNTFGSWPTAATLKALLIHTADDIVPPVNGARVGPDYATGWGHANIDAAIDVIDADAQAGWVPVISGGHLGPGLTSLSHYFVAEAGTPIVVTLVWTDPAGTETSTNDDPTIKLVNDLDVRLAAPGGATSYPFVLDPANPSLAATTGDNVRDNVEQVRIASAPTTGMYTITVSHKGTLVGAEQTYSMIVSGAAPDTDGDWVADFGEWTNAALQSPGSAIHTNVWLGDSDNDGLADGWEAQPPGAYSFLGASSGTDPRNPDTDDDGWLDGVEYFNPSHFPNGPLVPDVLPDADGDGLPDSMDSDSSLADANGDGIPDGRDSDGDGFSDSYEEAYHSQTNVSWDYPELGDVDFTSGRPNVADVTTLGNWAAGLGVLPVPTNADIDANGVVDAADATALADWLAGPAPYQLP